MEKNFTLKQQTHTTPVISQKYQELELSEQGMSQPQVCQSNGGQPRYSKFTNAKTPYP